MGTDDLAVALSILRIIRRWSQSELAEAAGVTNSAVSDYERGKVDPQTRTLQKLIRALGLPLSALDQTQAFILSVRSQMAADEDLLPEERRAMPTATGDLSLRTEIAEVASEGGRFASRLTRVLLQLMAGDRV
jgi:transcriptional regulator with XRE-family HTH domain